MKNCICTLCAAPFLAGSLAAFACDDTKLREMQAAAAPNTVTCEDNKFYVSLAFNPNRPSVSDSRGAGLRPPDDNHYFQSPLDLTFENPVAQKVSAEEYFKAKGGVGYPLSY